MAITYNRIAIRNASPPVQKRYPILRHDEVGDGLFELWLDAPALAAARPGQFVHVACGAGLLRRPFSLYRIEGGAVAILYRVVGTGTRALAARRPGDMLDVLGPLGRAFDAPEAGDRIVLVGGGVGVPPLAFYAATYGLDARHRAVMGFRSRGQVVGLAPFHRGDVKLDVLTDDGTFGRAGRVTDGLAGLVGATGATRVLTCGPDAMMRAVAEVAASRHVRCEVSVERPMGCGIGICLGCVVPMKDGSYARACAEGPVLEAAEVAW